MANPRLISLSFIQNPTAADKAEAEDLNRALKEDLAAATANLARFNLSTIPLEDELEAKLNRIRERKAIMVKKLENFHSQILSSGFERYCLHALGCGRVTHLWYVAPKRT